MGNLDGFKLTKKDRFLDELHNDYVKRNQKTAIAYESVNRIERNKKEKLAGLNVKKSDPKVCRLCKNGKNCHYRDRVLVNGSASVGIDFEEFGCDNWKLRESVIKDSTIKSLLKTYKVRH